MRRFAFVFLSLLFAVALTPSHAAVSKSKTKKSSSRSFRKAPSVKWPGHVSTIVIDAGHGGWDRGGIPGQSISEKNLTLDVAKKLSARLQSAGFRTVMTRRDDTFVSLPKRAAITNAQQNAIFVSIHFNSSPRSGARGFETHYSSSASARLARSIQSNLMGCCRTENRGVKHAGFYVLRNAKIPAVLVECGFLTNRDEGRLTLKASHRQRMANAIASGIIAQCKN